jgi:hypothetical protein
MQVVPAVVEATCDSWGVHSTGANGYYFNDLLLLATPGAKAGLPASWSYTSGGHSVSSGYGTNYNGGFLALDLVSADDLASNQALFAVPESCN